MKEWDYLRPHLAALLEEIDILVLYIDDLVPQLVRKKKAGKKPPLHLFFSFLFWFFLLLFFSSRSRIWRHTLAKLFR